MPDFDPTAMDAAAEEFGKLIDALIAGAEAAAKKDGHTAYGNGMLVITAALKEYTPKAGYKRMCRQLIARLPALEQFGPTADNGRKSRRAAKSAETA